MTTHSHVRIAYANDHKGDGKGAASQPHSPGRRQQIQLLFKFCHASLHACDAVAFLKELRCEQANFLGVRRGCCSKLT